MTIWTITVRGVVRLFAGQVPSRNVSKEVAEGGIRPAKNHVSLVCLTDRDGQASIALGRPREMSAGV